MEYLVSASEMKAADSATIQHFGMPSNVLMERAALACAEVIRKREAHLGRRTVIMAGSGNNGGDGLAVGRLLLQAGFQVDFVLVGEREKCSRQTRLQLEILENYGCQILKEVPKKEYDIVVDALFGIGLRSDLKGRYAEAVEEINAMNAFVLAVDMPSGIDADSGAVCGCAVRADVTVTFAWRKLGLVLYPGAAYAGEVITAQIGITQESFLGKLPRAFTYTQPPVTLLPARNATGNKGTFGKVLLFAGSKGMAGAAVLSALAVLHSGAGMVRILSGEENRQILQTCVPEAMLSVYDDTPEGQRKALLEALSWADVVAAGPGLGTQEAAHRILTWMLEEIRSPLILDADAINILARDEELLQALCLRQRQQERHIGLVLTPHPGELSRLSGLAIDEALQDPFAVCAKWAERFGAVCLCKGARTVVAEPAGTFYVNTSGNSGMATAGSGDVLTGILAALLAQGMKPFEAACAGVYLHGCAGDAAAAQKNAYSLVARDLILGLDGLMK